jgi:hypothetical protein
VNFVPNVLCSKLPDGARFSYLPLGFFALAPIIFPLNGALARRRYFSSSTAAPLAYHHMCAYAQVEPDVKVGCVRFCRYTVIQSHGLTCTTSVKKRRSSLRVFFTTGKNVQKLI